MLAGLGFGARKLQKDHCSWYHGTDVRKELGWPTVLGLAGLLAVAKKGTAAQSKSRQKWICQAWAQRLEALIIPPLMDQAASKLSVSVAGGSLLPAGQMRASEGHQGQGSKDHLLVQRHVRCLTLGVAVGHTSAITLSHGRVALGCRKW